MSERADAKGAPEVKRAPRWRRGLAGCLAAPPLTLLVLLCFVHCTQRGAEPVLAPHEGAAPVVSEAPPPMEAGADRDGDGLDDAQEVALARRFAPSVRFAGVDPQGRGGQHNVAERYFPMSVARFLAQLEAGVYEREGQRWLTEPGSFSDERVVGYPSFLKGDPPRAAPVYVHVYPGEESGTAFCEYWLFYPYDVAEARFLGVEIPYGGHRGDWEHAAFKVALDPPRVLGGYFYGHDKCLVVAAEDLELIEGTHPAVYVSQGKHASYPTAVVIPSVGLPQAIVGHLDVANGLGERWDTWRDTALIDLGEREQPRDPVARWLGFQGPWGPDGVWLGSIEIGTSATGPTAKREWRNNGPGTPWREHLASRGGVLVNAGR